MRRRWRRGSTPRPSTRGWTRTPPPPVISSTDMVNSTVLAGPAINITAGLSNTVRDVVEKVVAFTINATTTIPSSLVNHTSEQGPSTSFPTTISNTVKKVVELLGKEPSIPVATVCI